MVRSQKSGWGRIPNAERPCQKPPSSPPGDRLSRAVRHFHDWRLTDVQCSSTNDEGSSNGQCPLNARRILRFLAELRFRELHLAGQYVLGISPSMNFIAKSSR